MTDDVTNELAMVWWNGGKLPIDDEARRRTGSHEMNADGSLVCRCGERHQTPGEGWFVVRLNPTTQAAEVWVRRNVHKADTCASPTGAPIDRPRIVHGVVDTTTEIALARHLTPGRHDGVVTGNPEDVARVIAHETELDLTVIERDALDEAFASARTLVQQRGSSRPRLITLDVPPDTKLRAVSDFLTSLLPASHEGATQLSVGFSSTTRVSILEGRT